jgi:formamidopyrimidine-DNA glycosylase
MYGEGSASRIFERNKMPELPEVETIRKGLLTKAKGKKIKKVEIRVPKLFIGDKNKIIGAKIKDVRRVAKILEIVLSNGYSIIIHLKLTGQLVYVAKGEKKIGIGIHFQKAYGQLLPHAHTHVIYTFSDGSHLYFNDLMKFGWHKIVKTSEIKTILGPDKFGPEPLTKDFSEEYLKDIFSRTGRKVKEVLMDQKKISGIGNIYANDSLYWAGILPFRTAKSLSDSEIKKLKAALEKVIKLGLKYGGSSENTYVNIEGKKGNYMKMAAVYQQKTDPKGHLVKRQKFGGRSAFWCPICQK